MPTKKIATLFVLLFCLSSCLQPSAIPETTPEEEIAEPAPKEELHPMSIKHLRSLEFIGGDFVIEKELVNGTNYKQYIASYRSEGLKIYGLLTVPLAPKPEKGFPAILFIHGYIPPREYSTTGNYPTYQARLARAGFVTYKPDLRGHGDSEGEPVSAHYSEKYIVDTLSALAYLKKYTEIDPLRIGYWGHSNGGQIGLRILTISPDIKAASLWAGVVGSYEHMFETYHDKIDFLSGAHESELVKTHGLPSTNSDFWNQIDPYAFLGDITAPIEIQHGTADSSVPVELSDRLHEALQNANKTVEYHVYTGDDHNIGKNVNKAFDRTIAFYKKNI